jgi:hypothetical protein
MSSIKGKADLWRSGKDGSSPGKRVSLPGGGDDFQARAKKSTQFKKGGYSGANGIAAADNKGVFANSIAGLAASDKPFMPDPGSGRDVLDMYSIPGKVEEFGLGMARQYRKSSIEE